uniref:NADH-ubiquinone oxidoreductase chain 2 n=1 Tax=Mictyris longicarpus TaxID=516892 RepID=A0A090MFZ0_9EUCA|nr:NADH dehydrogenase subunit 2 [Mictyris longicarpus]CEG06227.1 NADH dehydrogenase subunit 2 [Mictyris longicarpus]
MMFPFSYFLFFFTLVLGIIISISSPSWFGAWIGLELNLLSFIPLITLKMNSYLSEAALKYFLVQALGSALLISSSLFFISFLFFGSLCVLSALLLKLGAAPFYFWFPQVMKGLMWPQAFFLASVQKLAPLALLSFLTLNSKVILIVSLSAVMSALTGALGGLNLMNLREIIAFSSINHLSWMLMAISINDTLWILYYTIYFLVLLSIVSTFHKIKASSISNILQSSRANSSNKLSISLSLFSLGGLPPLTGFIPKWVLIQVMLNLHLFATLFFLLFSSLLTLYYYLRILTPFILLFNPLMSTNMKNKHSMSTNHLFSSSIYFNLIGILFPIYPIFF